jgi:queuine/archaeosine tRNA-ribosyltransferase
VGGMVPLKTPQIEESLAVMNEVRLPATRLHLLGVTRTEKLPQFSAYGVASFDSTSPLRQAFKDDRDNYYTPDRTYAAIRIPQVEGNPKLERSIRAGKTSQGDARTHEKACLDIMVRFDRGQATVDEALAALGKYEELFSAVESKTGARRNQLDIYREVLEARPWKACPCAVCQALGHHVILFRGAERNRRRGLHNVWVFYRRVQQQLRELSARQKPTKQRKPRAAASATNGGPS